ncbi:paired amphipathic helix protein Sin3-like protein 2 [Tanacetum coccineum]
MILYSRFDQAQALAGDKQEKYDMFTYVLGKFKEQRIDTAFVVASVKLLFKGHNDLIVGLNTFLPKGSEIIITEDNEASAKRTTTEFKEAKTFLRPFGSSPGKSSGQQQSPGGGGCSSAQKKQELTAIDALTYLIKVHDTFPKNKEKYHIFLDLMKDFKDKRIDTAGVVQSVKDLFKWHNDLLIGFSAFLSDDIDVPKI